ncbi:MAG: hypothetical protein COX40_03635 [Candidatus Omnitrophica bacterium CG23_combo_of_CG06-09_8_20_14_all_40_11]|nr:MAG: hypothetical protein COX40_03635 [Candidatus Omnitrophica bacterium CG23_combo_of_CG06-09_8_20_14_all_40_11]
MGVRFPSLALRNSMFKFKLVFLLFGYLLLTTCYLLFLSGCATAPYVLPTKPKVAMPGIYHRVEKGQTLWRISKIYSVDLDEIARINRIPDATSIEPGQLIFIPSVQRKQYLPGQSSAEDFSWPLRGRVIASFGQTFNDMINKGINIQSVKSQDIIASRSGKVIFYGSNLDNFGKTVIIEHSDGFSTVYARNSEVFVKIGDYVQRGTVIAKVGSSDRDKNTYLHFEIRKGYIPQNPYFYLPR